MRRTNKSFKPRGEAIEGIKIQVPPFVGKTDPDAYLEWEKKVEFMFNCSDYTEEQQMKLAVMAFSEYAITSGIKLPLVKGVVGILRSLLGPN